MGFKKLLIKNLCYNSSADTNHRCTGITVTCWSEIHKLYVTSSVNKNIFWLDITTTRSKQQKHSNPRSLMSRYSTTTYPYNLQLTFL